MCFLAVKNYSLDKKLVRLEQEAKSIKASQNYGMNGVKMFSSNSLSFTSQVYERSIGGYIIRQWRIKKDLLFIGEYANRTAIGLIKLTQALVLPGNIQTNEIFYYGTSNPNEVQIHYECYGQEVGSGDAFTEIMHFEANMKGVLREL